MPKLECVCVCLSVCLSVPPQKLLQETRGSGNVAWALIGWATVQSV